MRNLLKRTSYLAAAAVLGAVLTGASPAAAAPAATATDDSTVSTAAVVTELWRVFNVRSEKVIAVKGASTANGAAVIQYDWSDNGVNNDLMIFEWVNKPSSNWVRIKPLHTYSNDGNVHNDKCLAVLNASNTSGVGIVSANCSYDSINNDVWLAESVLYEPQPGFIAWATQYRNLKSQLCLVVQGSSPSNGAALIQYACNGTHNSLWNVASWPV